MDDLVIHVFQFYDRFARAIRVNARLVSPSPAHGYMNVLGAFCIFLEADFSPFGMDIK
jgi:hypothetical protein